MIYYELKPVKAIYAERGKYGIQPINAVYYGARKIWSPNQTPIEDVRIKIKTIVASPVNTGLVCYWQDPNYPDEMNYIGEGATELRFNIGDEIVIGAYAVEDLDNIQINMYYEKEGETGVLYENKNFLFIDTSSPGVWNLTVSLVPST